MNCNICGVSDPPNIVVWDSLWSVISKRSGCNFLCKECMEEILGRPIKLSDLKFMGPHRDIIIPVNVPYIKEFLKEGQRGLIPKDKYRYYTLDEYLALVGPKVIAKYSKSE